MNALDHVELNGMLDRLKLTAIRDQLDTLLDEAARSEMTLREALGFLVSREIARRDERRISMASKIAQFPFVRELEGFMMPPSWNVWYVADAAEVDRSAHPRGRFAKAGPSSADGLPRVRARDSRTPSVT